MGFIDLYEYISFLEIETGDDKTMDKNLLNEVYIELCEIAGEENMLKIYRLFKGQQISFPMRLYDPKLLRKAIVRECNGRNISYLACKYNYSERSIRRMLKYENEHASEKINHK